MHIYLRLRFLTEIRQGYTARSVGAKRQQEDWKNLYAGFLCYLPPRRGHTEGSIPGGKNVKTVEDVPRGALVSLHAQGVPQGLVL